ncbi:uncharacterized protein H6S33_007118 [Morchella sextelata]|uniref:uncharacterized protein n=1 Tax=Morchella sextelata TaxID=1174677 RepID=UPI001D04910F|nr:uncharacterized protein H6S33_007118 [Morchella sextelata]KAH0604087.1 hypothetical protein H6S33_007118 [Morchella sextelata]
MDYPSVSWQDLAGTEKISWYKIGRAQVDAEIPQEETWNVTRILFITRLVSLFRSWHGAGPGGVRTAICLRTYRGTVLIIACDGLWFRYVVAWSIVDATGPCAVKTTVSEPINGTTTTTSGGELNAAVPAYLRFLPRPVASGMFPL